jgi:hypothetical protein
LEPESRQIGLIDFNHSTETDFVRHIIAPPPMPESK